MIYKNRSLAIQNMQSMRNTQEDEQPIVTTPNWRVEDWFGDRYDEQTYAKLKQYWEILIQYNRKINLVADSTIKNADEIHFADSL